MSTASFKDLEIRRQRALEEAAAWLVRLQSNALSLTDRSALTDWLRESPLHVAAMLRVSQTDRALASFDAWDSIPVGPGAVGDAVIDWPSSPPVRQRSVPSKFFRLRTVAAVAFAIVLMSAVAAELWWRGIIGGPTFETATGERRDVALADGSTLRLGPQTRVRVQLTQGERWIALQQGEAVFKVAKDPTRPFDVYAGAARVRALGTEFGIEKRDAAILVTVAEGRVAVSQNDPALFLHSGSLASEGAVALVAGDQLSVPTQGTGRSRLRKVDSGHSLAWANGRLIFENDTLGTVLERFNQYNSVQLKVTDPRLAERRISGSFDATDLESLLAFLHSAVPANAQRSSDGQEITLSSGSNTGER